MIGLTPAYGRDYATRKAVLVDLKANKDFIISDHFDRWDGKPVSPHELAREGEILKVRFGQLRKQTTFKPSEVLS